MLRIVLLFYSLLEICDRKNTNVIQKNFIGLYYCYSIFTMFYSVKVTAFQCKVLSRKCKA